MATITRDDNTEFIAQPYREQLSIRNYTVLKREIQHLSQVNGQFVRLFKLASGNYEVAFSHDPGFLLGETVWHHFGKPDNLIYCEELNDNEVIFVLIRSGSVFLDGKYLKSALKNELSMLKSASDPFLIKTYGDVPLAFNSEEAKAKKDSFEFDPLLIRAHNELSESAFNQLAAKSNLQLLSLEQALLEFRSQWPAVISMLIITLIVVFAGYLYTKHSTTTVVAKQPEVHDPFLKFRMALSTPSPVQQLQGVAQEITLAYGIPGWVLSNVKTSGVTTSFSVNSLGGSLKSLFQWAHLNNSQVNLGSAGATLQMNKGLPRRAAPTTIVSAKLVSAKIIDDLLQLLPGRSVTISNFKNYGAYKESDLTIRVSNITPNILSLIGNQLQGLPVKLNGINLQVGKGLLSGSIKLAILGN